MAPTKKTTTTKKSTATKKPATKKTTTKKDAAKSGDNVYINKVSMMSGQGKDYKPGNLRTYYAKVYDEKGNVQKDQMGDDKKVLRYALGISSESLGHTRNENGRYTKRVFVDGLTDKNIVPSPAFDSKGEKKKDKQGNVVIAKDKTGRELYNVRLYDDYKTADGEKKSGTIFREQKLEPVKGKTGQDSGKYAWVDTGTTYQPSKVAAAVKADRDKAFAAQKSGAEAVKEADDVELESV